jgi:hypothetical protein
MAPPIDSSSDSINDRLHSTVRDTGSLTLRDSLAAKSWNLFSPFGIFDPTQNGWFTGSVWAVHPLGGGRLLLGTEQGGLWLSEPDGKVGFSSLCLSDKWEHWGITALLADPADSDRIFVGCNDVIGTDGVGNDGMRGGIYVGKVSTGKWKYLQFPPEIVGGVYSMIIIPKQRLLVVATGTGTSAENLGNLLWTSIDEPFVWDSVPATASDLANSTYDDFLIVDQSKSLLRRAHIQKLSTTAGHGAPLPFLSHDVVIKWNIPPVWWTPIRIASCAADPHYVYCIGESQLPVPLVDPGLFAIRSTDGGENWEECGYDVLNRPEVLPFAQTFGALEGGPKTRYSVAVHPKSRNMVALGAKAVLLSNDSGTSWFSIDSGGVVPKMTPWHDDIHELRFDEENNTLLVPSDGGILSVPNWIEGIPKVPVPADFPSDIVSVSTDDRRNRTLPIVMLLDPTTRKRKLMGNLSVDPAGNIAAGTQDNGNLWLTPGRFWKPIDYGDGGFVAVSSNWDGTFCVHGQSGGNDLAMNWAKLEGDSWTDLGILPLTLNDSSSSAIGIKAGKETFPNGTVRAMPADFTPWPITALASYGDNVVLGALISSSSSIGASWRKLGTVPASEHITALEPHDPISVLVGTSSGRLFRLFLYGKSIKIFFNDQTDGAVEGIASNGETILCFKGGAAQQFVYGGQLGDTSYKYFHSHAGLTRLPISSFPPNDGSRIFRSIAASRLSVASALGFALIANEHEVWVSRTQNAATWHLVTYGLPAAVRCADLRFSASGDLFLSTYGRGVWLFLS